MDIFFCESRTVLYLRYNLPLKFVPFCTLLHACMCNALSFVDENNIALHLLLDIGQCYSLTDMRQMKYSNGSINFWLALKNIQRTRS